MRLKGMKLIGQRLDKKHKEYKEGKKVIKGIIKRQQFRGNVIPWCQFASFELETSSLPEVIQEIYLQALQLAWSLKQKSNLQKGKFRQILCHYVVITLSLRIHYVIIT